MNHHASLIKGGGGYVSAGYIFFIFFALPPFTQHHEYKIRGVAQWRPKKKNITIGGSFKCFIFTPTSRGFMIQFDEVVFIRWVKLQPPTERPWPKPWLFRAYRRLYKLPSYIGIIRSHYKDPYQPINMKYNGMSVQGFERGSTRSTSRTKSWCLKQWILEAGLFFFFEFP